MNIQELRTRCIPLFRCNTISDGHALLDIYSDFLFKAVQKHHLDEVNNVADAQAKIILQMMFTKILHLKSVLAGISYTAESEASLKGIMDPTVLAVLIRNIYETVGMFNLVYRQTKTPDEKLILYNLWVHAGLSYRQKFISIITTEENKQKAQEEQQMMEALVNEVQSTELYKSLDDRNKNKVLQKIKDKDYLLRFQNREAVFLHWHNLVNVMGIKDGMLDQIYTYFSLYAHPSNVSVFQFADMFGEEDQHFLFMAQFNLRNLFVLLSSFIADYVHLFPKTLETFNSSPLINQLAINFHNKYARGEEYSINDSWKHLG